MLYLVLSVLCSSLVIHTFRFAQGRQQSVDRLLLVNYLMASITGWVQVATTPGALAPHQGLAPLLALALVTGALFIGNFYLLGHAVSRLGPSLAGAASRMSAVLPVVLSVIVFSELPGPWSWAGIGLALAALPLSIPSPAGDRTFHRPWLPALAVFVGFGVNDFTLKIQNNLFPPVSKTLFLAVVYTVALVIALVRWWTTRGQSQGGGGVWLTGAVLGAANYFSALFFSWALGQLPGSQAYALTSVGVIAVVTLSSVLLWKERLTLKSAAFLLAAAASIALIQVR